MRIFLKLTATCFILFLLTGCGGASKSYYIMQPTPLVSGKSTYNIKNLDLVLVSYAKDPKNHTYMFDNEVQELFDKSITDQLKMNNILGDEYSVEIKLHYTRIFNYGGNALNKPEFYYSAKIYDANGELVVDYITSKGTIKYGYFKDIAVNIQIGAYQRKSEHEIEDIELISKIIVDDIKKLGK